MILETVRILADWLDDPTYGVNALASSVPRDTGVDQFPRVRVYDSTRDGRVTRGQIPDVDNLPALVVRDLARRNSGGFGSLPIHAMLRRAQLDDCLRLQPNLLQTPRFVDVYLQRLAPSADGDWRLEVDAIHARRHPSVQSVPPCLDVASLIDVREDDAAEDRALMVRVARHHQHAQCKIRLSNRGKI